MNSRNDSRRLPARRGGAIMIMMVLCIIGLFGLLALAIEIGLVAVGRSQAQNAADASAMAGARTINGDSINNFNLTTAPSNAVKAATVNSILAQMVTGNSATVASTGIDTYASGQVSLVLGTYGYNYNDSDSSKEGFAAVFPRAATSTEPYAAVRSTVTGTANLNFARVFGLSSRSVQATAVAVHRPRDVFIIMDLSGSMRFQSLLGTPYSGSRTTSMNPDPDYPKFGHYNDTSGAALYGNSSIPAGTGEYYDPANISYTTNSGPPIIEDFYQNAVGVAPSAANRAFARSSADYSTTPGGDNYLKKSLNDSTKLYAHNVYEFNNNSSTTNVDFETKGYEKFYPVATPPTMFKGYTEGPGYWGKTFFVWPPNPGFTTPANWSAPTSLTDTAYKWYSWNDSYPRDWRQRFFVAVRTSNSSPGVIQHNSILFSSSGLKTPGTTTSVTENDSSVNYTFRINYAAILYWLKQEPVHFPSTVQAGRIRYYTAIPDGTDNTLNNRWWTTKASSLTNNERFWKHYIDFVLGYEVSSETSSSYTYDDIGTMIGNGDFYTWSGSSLQAGQRSDRPSSNYVNLSRNPTSPYTPTMAVNGVDAKTGPYQTTASYYQTAELNANRSGGSTSITLGSPSLSQAPVQNVHYVRFNSSTTSYKITNSSTSSVSITPSLSGSLSNNDLAKVYSSNNSIGTTSISLPSSTVLPSVVPLEVIPSNTSPRTDRIGFNGDVTRLYSPTSSSTETKLVLPSPGLLTAINNIGDSVEVYGSDGAVGSTKISVVLPGVSKVKSGDYMIVNGDTAQPYRIAEDGIVGNNGGFLLTISPGLVSAVSIRDVPIQIFTPYMNYADDVIRPKHHFWFGPLTWVDWLGNYNTGKFWWPGNAHEAQAWACKVGIQTAIDDIKNNHPNDFLGMTFFSSPMDSRTASGNHNRAIVPLGRNYQQLKDSLWFPPTTVTGTATEITPYSADMSYVPRAYGGTSPGMGFMIGYNQLSNSLSNLRLYASPSSSYRGNAGGLGRKGAQRLIIFETDGVPNSQAFSTIQNYGSNSYYPIRVKDPTDYSDTTNVEWPNTSTFSMNDVYTVIKQITAMETASPPGYSTARQNALVYPIGYGSLFDPSNTSTQQTNALNFMQTAAFHGKTSTTTTGTNFPDLLRIYGTNTQRITRMQNAFTSIMQSGTQVSLIE